MTFVVGPFTHGRGTSHHVLRVEFTSGLDRFNGRTLCGRRGVVRATWQMHQVKAAWSKLKESASPCGKCAEVLEKRWAL